MRALVSTVVNEIYGDLFAPPGCHSERSEESLLSRYPEKDWSPAWVAVSDAKIVGVVLTHEERISDLWVLRENRRHGVGRKLLAQAESEIAARGHRTARLRVVKSNVAAVQFYLRQGWQIAREFPHEKFHHAMLEMVKASQTAAS